MLFFLFFSMGFFALLYWEMFYFWAVLEVFLLCLLYKMVKDSSGAFSSFMVFFIIEVLLSVFFIMSALAGSSVLCLLFVVGKMGMFPFWVWVVRFFSDQTPTSSFLVMGVYKVLPLVFFFQLGGLSSFLFSLLVFFNLLSSVFLFFWSQSLEVVFAWLCIFSSGWLLVSFFCGLLFGVLFFFIYILMLGSLLLVPGSPFSGQSFLWTYLFYIGFPPLPSFTVKLLVMLAGGGSSFLLFLFCLFGVISFFSFIWFACQENVKSVVPQFSVLLVVSLLLLKVGVL